MTERRPMEVRRAEIADAALRLIGTRGIADLTMASLAEAVGVTPGALFRHYPSREAILDAAAARAEELLAPTVPSPDLPPLERLRALVLARSATVGSNAGLSRLLLSEQFAMALPPAAAERLRGLITRTRGWVRAVLAEAIESGAIRDDIDPDSLAVLVLGTVQALALATGSTHGKPLLGARKPAEVWDALEALLAMNRPGRSRPAAAKRKS
ncbi:MAG: TetR/AcrR family transcriptional regulator [Deltaproteobacteria bacterium]